ncbi:ATP-binding protein [Methylogaea oryzae]|uniref:ATP-binding protein n=1 Tax=Methylogaea oryzae TaxID=1295382 RepID=UPI000A843003|nr:ATP-binding protein [Methylogaea oryzae]
MDKELRHVDALLADTNRPRLTARGVSYVEDPIRLAKLIGTADWLPVDAKLKVGDVAKLVRTLGGEQLYGKNCFVPLRELIQNASDAVRARRIMEEKPINWGQVTVRIGQDNTGQWVEVEDCGIGMSESVLIGPFLDFGTSFWGTSLMHRELPGLESKGYVSSGQFGIGFYSVFMWGDRVQVITRRAERARDETLILEFQNGLASRPILRKASSSECLHEGGTRVRVWVTDPMFLHQLLAESDTGRPWTLEERCAWLCPTLDVNLFVEAKKTTLVVGASDWISIKGSKLLQRLWGPASRKRDGEVAKLLRTAERNLRTITNSSGHIIGRACITPSPPIFRNYEHVEMSLPGTVTIGGFRSSGLFGICGCLVGTPHTAARNIGVPIAEPAALQQWATEQAAIARKDDLSSEQQAEIASLIRVLNGATKELHIAKSANGWKSAADIASESIDDEVFVVHDASVYLARREHGDFALNKNVFAVEMGMPGILEHQGGDVWIDWPETESREEEWSSDWIFDSRTLQGALIEAIANAWNVPLATVLKNAKQSTDRKEIKREIGCTSSGPVIVSVTVLNRPKHH